MKLRSHIAWLGAYLLLCPAIAHASEAWTVKVYQPFNVPNGIFASPVTYVGYYDPDQAVEMTVWPNRVWHPEWGRPLQENAAFSNGIKVRLQRVARQTDTLTVQLDAKAVASRIANGWDDATLVTATVECLKANAGQFMRTHFLRLIVTGRPGVRRFGGVFDVRGYSCGPKVRQFP
jgi:hypothetical protein